MSPKPLLLAVLALAACETETTEPQAPEPETAVAAPTPAAVPTATVQETVDAIGTDITAMPLAAATANIDAWTETLRAADFEQAEFLVEGLETLRAQLGASPIDGPAVAATLADLGSKTTASAANAPADVKSGLITLGTALTDAANVLSGMIGEEQDSLGATP